MQARIGCRNRQTYLSSGVRNTIPVESSLLGIEAGGTRTVALLASADGRLWNRQEWGPGNLRLLNDRELSRHFQRIAAEFPRPAAVAVAMAGVRTAADRTRVSAVLNRIWPRAPHSVTHDLESAWWAAQPSWNAGPPKRARVIVLSGTGSCCYGKTPRGKTSKVGGWGHLLGDRGSGYEIGLQGLKGVVKVYDRGRLWPRLGARLLRALQFNSPEEFIDWAQGVEKAQIAGLAQEVFAAWLEDDPVAREVIEVAASQLAEDAVACARQLGISKGKIEFSLAGGILLKQARFADLVRQRLRKLWPNSTIDLLPRESAWGAVELARQALVAAGVKRRSLAQPSHPTHRVAGNARFIPRTKGSPPTEQTNPHSTHLDRMPLRRTVRLMISEEANVTKAVSREAARVAAAVDLIAKAFRRGGRLFYVGAGTSGRLGVLDASECPPTFGVPPELVQGVIAGGSSALWKSVEGAEDDWDAGAQALKLRRVTRRDVVVGISASGRAAFVWGALRAAKSVGAPRVLICCNPNLIFPRGQKPDVVIALPVGPEVLAGSSRLKAGTATKLVLNMLTTLAMVQTGRVTGNLMTALNPANAKLKRRAASILAQLSGWTPRAAEAQLQHHGWNIRSALKETQA